MPTPKHKILSDLEVLGDAAVSGTISVEGVEMSLAGAASNQVLQFRDGKFQPKALSLEAIGVDVPTTIAISWWMGN